jgi:hypothetical protein
MISDNYEIKKILYEMGTKWKKVGQQTRKMMHEGEDRAGAKEFDER